MRTASRREMCCTHHKDLVYRRARISGMNTQGKMSDLVSEINLRKNSDQSDLAFTYERHVLATVLQNQLTIIQILGEIDPIYLKRFNL